MKKLLLILAAAACAAILVGLVRLRAEPFAPRVLCLTALDVGQGDSLLLDLPDGGHWLIDGGGGAGDVGRYRVLPALRRRGIDRLDGVVATHGDADHAEGLLAVLDALEVGELWIPDTRGNPALLRELVGRADRRGVEVRAAVDGHQPSVVAPGELELLHPWPGYVARPEGENDRSIVLRASLGRVSFLLTGDVELSAEERLVLAGRAPRSTVIKVPHHGSRTSSTDALLERVDPLAAVAGVGVDNRFGFPHASVRRRYLQRGVPLLWTGQLGSIRACTEGWSLQVHRAPQEGRWEEVGRWDAAAIDAWWRRGLETRPEPPRCAEAEADWEKPERTKKRRRRRRRKAKPAPTPEPEPTPPVLLDEKEWERHRKRRGRFR